MSSENPEPQQQAATPEPETKFYAKFYEQALAEFDNEELDPGIWAIVCLEFPADEEASKSLYVKLRANALLTGYTLLVWVNRIIWIAVFGVVFLVGLAAIISGAFNINTNFL